MANRRRSAYPVLLGLGGLSFGCLCLVIAALGTPPVGIVFLALMVWNLLAQTAGRLALWRARNREHALQCVLAPLIGGGLVAASVVGFVVAQREPRPDVVFLAVLAAATAAFILVRSARWRRTHVEHLG